MSLIFKTSNYYRIETEGTELLHKQRHPITDIVQILYIAIISLLMHDGDFYGMSFDSCPSPTKIRFKVDKSFRDVAFEDEVYYLNLLIN